MSSHSISTKQKILPKVVATVVAVSQLALYGTALTNFEDITQQQHVAMPLLGVGAGIGLLLCWVNVRLAAYLALFFGGALMVASAYYNPPASFIPSVMLILLPFTLPPLWLLAVNRGEPSAKMAKWLSVAVLIVVALSLATLFVGTSTSPPQP